MPAKPVGAPKKIVGLRVPPALPRQRLKMASGVGPLGHQQRGRADR